MVGNRIARLAAIHQCALIVTALTGLTTFGSVASALASEHHPQGIFASFADCPLNNPSLHNCFTGETTSGAFVIGKKTIPVDRPIVLQGGLTIIDEEGEQIFIGAEDGNTLSKTALGVPGGLLGILSAGSLPVSLRNLLDRLVGNGTTGVTLMAELAKPASMVKLHFLNALLKTEVALQLPLKVKLSNAFLGKDCYIGSSSNPIVVSLTTGVTSPPAPNKPIRGTFGELQTLEEGSWLVAPGTSLVDNAFTAPAASGCGGASSAVVDPAIDADLGLPSAAGHNTAILTGEFKFALAKLVKESE